MAESGCPPGFATGSVSQDNENFLNRNKFVPKNITEYLSGEFGSDIQLDYCTRVDSMTSDPAWPPGQYCVAKKFQCPAGFSVGELFWDDENLSVFNRVQNTVPDGTYDHNTRINYCCRSDGNFSTPIALPTSNDFVLYPHGSRNCQQVEGMTSKSLRIRFDDEDFNNRNRCSGQHPHDEGCGAGQNNHDLYLCHYKRFVEPTPPAPSGGGWFVG